MARLLLSALCLSTLLALAAACAAPPNGCNVTAVCDKLVGLSSNYLNTNFLSPGADMSQASSWLDLGVYKDLLADYQGVYNKLYTASTMDTRGRPPVNWEKFYAIAGTGQSVVGSVTVDSLSKCCRACANKETCNMYHYFDQKQVDSDPTTAYTLSDYSAKIYGGECFLLSGGLLETNRPPSGGRSVQAPKPKHTNSFVGGFCNGSPGANDDPHFMGAHGTRFDFNGELDKSFCLTTDTRLQINTLLKGYKSDNAVGATVGSDGKTIRSWMREVGLLWTDRSGAAHKLHLVARSGTQQERGEGFLARATLDGADVAVPQTPSQSVSDGDLTFTFLGTFKKGPFDLDRFRLVIDGLIDMSVSMRVAHPLLQSPTDAEAHFNLLIHSMEASEKVHGVLGQTYRETEEQQRKSVMYRDLSKLLGGPIKADGETGLGFLDGEVKDYVTSHVLAPDCKFSTFQM